MDNGLIFLYFLKKNVALYILIWIDSYVKNPYQSFLSKTTAHIFHLPLGCQRGTYVVGGARLNGWLYPQHKCVALTNRWDMKRCINWPWNGISKSHERSSMEMSLYKKTLGIGKVL